MKLAADQQTHDLPQPTLAFRRESWQAFQRLLDPLATPRPLPEPPPPARG